ncbi:MAG: hypothetical protein NT061_10560 [Spirochaetes bacterium]|nr:hypothetical protein [Spirochaetota bacterium]
MVERVHLELLEDEEVGQEALKIFHHAVVLVREVEIVHVAGSFEEGEGFGYFLAFPDDVKSVEKENVEVSVYRRRKESSTASRNWALLKSKR